MTSRDLYKQNLFKVFSKGIDLIPQEQILQRQKAINIMDNVIEPSDLVESVDILQKNTSRKILSDNAVVSS